LAELASYIGGNSGAGIHTYDIIFLLGQFLLFLIL
jgi:hypothetical protein